MNKQQALEELKQLKARADALESIINKPDEPNVFQAIHLNENRSVDQYYIGITMEISRIRNVTDTDAEFGVVFTTQEAAQKYLDYLKLVQRARKAMAAAWAGKPKVTWGSGTETKYCLTYSNDKLLAEGFCLTYNQFYFPSLQTATAFAATLNKTEARLLMMGMDA